MYQANTHYLAEIQSHWTRDEQRGEYPISWETVENNYESHFPIISAIINNNYEIIRYLVNTLYNSQEKLQIISILTARYGINSAGALSLIKYLKNIKCIFPVVLDNAITYENIPIIKYLISKQYRPAFTRIEVRENLSVLKYIHKKFPGVTFSGTKVNIRVFKYIINTTGMKNCVCDGYVLCSLPLIKFYAKRVSVIPNDLLRAASWRKDIALMKYMLKVDSGKKNISSKNQWIYDYINK